MFVELHMLQNFSPANLNRDDTNNPKDCEFGGARRARISSQCIKRAIRTSPVFAETTKVPVATRSKRLVEPLCQRLVEAGKTEEESMVLLERFVPQHLSKLDSDNDKIKTAVLLYMGPAELDSITQALLDEWDDLSDDKALKAVSRKLVRKHKGHTSAPDIALFGRMLAEKPELGLDAACQVAHAISTHRATMEMDFFTAVDDLNPDDTAGAGMMGFTGYNSACFYRYARIDWNQLVDNLDGDVDLARQTVEAFLRAAVAAVPSGKQTSFAAYNPPSFLLAVARQDGMGWSLANAFERPVRATRDSGLVQTSVEALDAYWGRLVQIYGNGLLASTAALAVDEEPALVNLEDSLVPNQEAWIQAICNALPVEEESV